MDNQLLYYKCSSILALILTQKHLCHCSKELWVSTLSCLKLIKQMAHQTNQMQPWAYCLIPLTTTKFQKQNWKETLWNVNRIYNVLRLVSLNNQSWDWYCNRPWPFANMLPWPTHLDLFIRCHSTEYNLCETLGWKHPEADPTNDSLVLYQR